MRTSITTKIGLVGVVLVLASCGGSSVPASCQVLMRGSCSIQSANTREVKVNVRGYTDSDAALQCTAFNASGQRVGGGRRTFPGFGPVNSLVSISLSPSGSVSRIRCEWFSR